LIEQVLASLRLGSKTAPQTAHGLGGTVAGTYRAFALAEL
jgi:hypothetical protein